MSKYRFTVALSFAGTLRPLVERIASILAAKYGHDAVLYDKFMEAELARVNLLFYLPALYRDESELIVAFISSDYSLRNWCAAEWRAIYSLVMNRKERQLMLIMEKPGLAPGLHGYEGYIPLVDLDPDRAASLIIKRLEFERGIGTVAKELPVQSTYYLAATNTNLLPLDRGDALLAIRQLRDGPVWEEMSARISEALRIEQISQKLCDRVMEIFRGTDLYGEMQRLIAHPNQCNLHAAVAANWFSDLFPGAHPESPHYMVSFRFNLGSLRLAPLVGFQIGITVGAAASGFVAAIVYRLGSISESSTQPRIEASSREGIPLEETQEFLWSAVNNICNFIATELSSGRGEDPKDADGENQA